MPSEQTAVTLRQVRIKDFKSVSEQTVDLKPLTAVVGANSSGKSTFIQAALLLIQHIRDSYSSDLQYSLNDDLVRLGTFAETARNNSDVVSSRMEIGLSFNNVSARPTRYVGDVATVADWDVVLSAHDSPTSKFATLQSFELSLKSVRGEEDYESFDLKIDEVFAADHPDGPELLRVPVEGDRLNLRAVAGRHTFAGETSMVSYAMFPSGELPQPYRLTRYADYLALCFVRSLEASFRSAAPRTRPQSPGRGRARARRAAAGLVTDKLLSDALPDSDLNAKLAEIEELGNELRIALAAEIRSGGPFAAFLDVSDDGLRESPDEEMDQDFHEINRALERIIKQLARYSANDFGDSATWTSEALETIKTAIRAALGQKDPLVLVPLSWFWQPSARFRAPSRQDLRNSLANIRYLGPIRDIDMDVSGAKVRRFVGKQGEYCADVIQRESLERLTNAPLPPDLPSLSAKPTFMDVLSGWLKYMQLAQQVEVEDHGRYKAGIRITPFRGHGSVPVSAVGVGVSQVLPVIVQCLLADPGRSLVVVEQPELHLHPSIEIKLADFLIECARTGRQIFVETHSEHLINRLRLAIAQDDSGETRNLVSVLFADQDANSGVTQYQSAEINQIGGVEGDGWPPNFLDLSTKQGLELLRTAVTRRQGEIFPAEPDDEF